MDLKDFKSKINETRFGFLFYLIPITILSVFFFMVSGCFFVILVPIGALAIPYYLGFKGPKRFAILGAFILVTNSLAFGAVSTSRAYDYKNYWGSYEAWTKYVEPLGHGQNLSDGVVSPLTGDADTEFTYSVTYTNGNNLPPLSVEVIVSDNLLAENSQETAYPMAAVDPTDTNYTDGAEYEFTTTLPALSPVAYPEWPNHFFYFRTEDARNTVVDTAFRENNLTSYALGPMNAGLLDQYSYSVIWSFYNMLFVIALYFLGVGMYWWFRQTRQRSSQWQERMEAMQKEEISEFECDKCGADVPEDAERCPKCGAKFDEDEEEAGEFECEECGADVPEDAKKCPKCGAKFDEDEKEASEFECEDCGADVPEDAEKCPKCGARFDEDEDESDDWDDEDDEE
jgi:ribosomal protein L40E